MTVPASRALVARTGCAPATVTGLSLRLLRYSAPEVTAGVAGKQAVSSISPPTSEQDAGKNASDSQDDYTRCNEALVA
jgi:hypothetical protein